MFLSMVYIYVVFRIVNGCSNINKLPLTELAKFVKVEGMEREYWEFAREDFNMC